MDFDLADVRAFLDVVANGSISAAAMHAGTSKSALSARITRLEKVLGATLLQRSSRGVTLTDIGLRFYTQMQDVTARFQNAVDDAAGGPGTLLTGHLRVASPTAFGIKLLGAPLFAFAARHPHLELTLDLCDDQVDVESDPYDLVVRVGPLADSSLVARPITVCERVLCCSAAYAERKGVPASVAAIREHECIHRDTSGVAACWQFAAREAGRPVTTVTCHGRIHASNFESMRDAAIAGLGLVVLPRFAIGDALSDGRLRVLLPDTPPTPDVMYAVYPHTRYVSRAVRAAIDMLVEHFDRGSVGQGARGASAT